LKIENDVVQSDYGIVFLISQIISGNEKKRHTVMRPIEDEIF
jgi:hypothetical protein